MKWLPRPASQRQERRGSTGSCVSFSGDDMPTTIDCLSPYESANGVPQWENPMEANLNSCSSIGLSPLPPKVPTKLPSSRVSRQRSLSSKSASPYQQQHQKLSYQSPTLLQQQQDHYTRKISPTATPNFASMVIECDNSRLHTTDDELTIDGSVEHDENTRRHFDVPNIDYNYNDSNNNHLYGSREKLQTISTETERHHYATHSIHASPRSNSRQQQQQQPQFRQQHQRMPTSHVVVPVSPNTSLEDEEMRQIELAMERSLQDMGSTSSFGHSSMMGSNSSFGHGSMMSSYSNANNNDQQQQQQRHSSNIPQRIAVSGIISSAVGSGGDGRYTNNSNIEDDLQPTTDPGLGFVWKRNERKLWVKVPITVNHHHEEIVLDGLHAISEECENYHSSRHMDYTHGQNLYDGVTKKDGLEYIDRDAAANRLMEIEREKQMLERIMRGIVSGDTSNETSHQPQQQHISRLPPTRKSSNSSDAILPLNPTNVTRRPLRGAMSMRTTSNEHQNHLRGRHTPGVSGNGVGAHHHNSIHVQQQHPKVEPSVYRSQSSRSIGGDGHSMSSGSTNSKMIWKRGPNGLWGRFPDDGVGDTEEQQQHTPGTTNDIHNSTNGDDDDEDAQIAEALRRSLDQM